MKPILLKIQSFGSYGKETIIDFTCPGQNLFLITGDTGAGKSTIFDAIVFALYGEASSEHNKKSGMIFQSQYVDEALSPYVTLEFEENNQTYTITRVPSHIRLAKRGGGLTNGAPSVELIMPDGRAYPAKEADAKIVDILGLTKAQFMQVAMIAQGEFMDSLRARSSDKKLIFRRLFKTEIYEQIVEEFAKRKKEKEVDMSKIKTACQTEINHIDAPDDFLFCDEINALKYKIINAKSLSITDMEALLDKVSQLLTYLEDSKKEINKKYEEKNKIYLGKRDALNEAKIIEERFAEADMAKAELEACEEEAPDIDNKRILVKKISKSYEAKLLFEHYIECENEVNQIEKKLDEAKQELPELIENYNQCVADEQEKNKIYENATGEFNKQKSLVVNALELFDKIDENILKHQAKTKELDAAQKEMNDCKKQLDDALVLENSYNEKIDELQNADALLVKAENKLSEGDRIFAEINKAGKIQKEIDEKNKSYGEIQKKYQEISEKYKLINEEYEVKSNKFFDAQAGILAKQLKPGEQCPVCGSTEHPSIHAFVDFDEDISKGKLDKLQNKVSKVREEREKAASQANVIKGICDEKNKLYDELVNNIEESVFEYKIINKKDADINEIEAAFTKWYEEQKCVVELRKADADLLAKTRKNAQELVQSKKQLEDNAKHSEKEYNDKKAELEGINQAIKAQEGLKVFADRNEANVKLKKEEEKYKIEKESYEQVKKRLDSLNKAKNNVEVLINEYTGSLPEKKALLNKNKSEYDAFVADNGISYDEWKEIVDNYDKDTASIEKLITDFDKKKSAAKTTYDNANNFLKDKKRPDMDKMDEECKASENEVKSVSQARENINQTFETNKKAYKMLCSNIQDRKVILEEHNKLERLYSLLSGKVTGSRMDLETFVQRYYMEKILAAANARFLEMSAGQFELRMVNIDDAGSGSNKGLDLMVYSNVTGREREIRTLSGGESFMAALALSLGMGDLIQTNSSAINLDIMFIDEGFGSLDDYSRSQAVKVLKEMAGSTKLIGIISHVTELKQEIDDQLVVTKDDNGSHISWQCS